jgi:hypothetical protein
MKARTVLEREAVTPDAILAAFKGKSYSQLRGIRAELKGIRLELDDLREKVENLLGYRKAINHVLERVAAIEKPLGIDTKARA